MFIELRIWWLTRKLRSADHFERKAAARRLGDLGDARAVNELIKALGGGADAEVAKALGKIRDSRAVEPLSRAVGSALPDVRRAAALALAELNERRAIQPLIEAARRPFGKWESDGSKIHDVRNAQRAAIEALGRFADPRVIAALCALASKEYGEGQYTAKEVLATMGYMPDGQPITAVRVGNDAKMRAEACHALTIAKDPHALELLTQSLADKEAEVRSAAAWALGALHDTRAVPVLVAALNDPHEHVRDSAVSALGSLGDDRAVGPLLAMLEGRNFVRRWRVVKALGMMHDHRIRDCMISVLEDFSDKESQRDAARALKAMPDSRLNPFQQDICDLLGEGVKPVSDLSHSAIKVVVMALNEDATYFDSVFDDVVKLIGRLGDASCVTTLVRATTNPWNSERAIDALQQVLCRDAANATTESLLQVSNLRDVKSEVSYMNLLDQESSTSVTPLSCSAVVEAARNELVRRGVEITASGE